MCDGLAVVQTTSVFSCKVYEILLFGCLPLKKHVVVFRLLQVSFSGGSSHHANSKKSLVFLLKFLSDLVPFEPPQYLKVDIYIFYFTSSVKLITVTLLIPNRHHVLDGS